MMTIKDFFKGDRFAMEQTGVELLEAKNGYARAQMKIMPIHLNGGGVCQGGAIFTLADFAAAVAMNSHKILTLSINADIHFFKAESTGILYAEAEEVFNQGHLAHCNVRITNEAGDLVAAFSCTGYHKKQELPIDDVE